MMEGDEKMKKEMQKGGNKMLILEKRNNKKWRKSEKTVH